MNQFWKTIVPVKGELIPEGAQYKVAQAGCKTWCPSMVGDTFRDVDKVLEWRISVECVPIDVAADVLLETVRYDDGFFICGEFADELFAEDISALRLMIIARMRELAAESVTT